MTVGNSVKDVCDGRSINSWKNPTRSNFEKSHITVILLLLWVFSFQHDDAIPSRKLVLLIIRLRFPFDTVDLIFERSRRSNSDARGSQRNVRLLPRQLRVILQKPM